MTGERGQKSADSPLLTPSSNIKYNKNKPFLPPIGSLVNSPAGEARYLFGLPWWLPIGVNIGEPCLTAYDSSPPNFCFAPVVFK